MSKSINRIGDWDCDCGHRFSPHVVYFAYAASLTAPAKVYCPKCGDLVLYGSPNHKFEDFQK